MGKKKKIGGKEYSLVGKSYSKRAAKTSVDRRRAAGQSIRTVKRQQNSGTVVDIYKRSTKTLWKRKNKK